MTGPLASTATAIYLILVSLLWGSFVNLAADRLPRGESILRPRSHCRTCGRVLGVVDLLPVLGYLIRGGRCATCRAGIGASQPLVEAACGLIMLAALLGLGLWPGAAIGLAAVAVFGASVISWAARAGADSNRARPG